MWNYRIIKNETDAGESDQYGLFEVFYNEKGEIFGHDSEPLVHADSIEEIIKSLELMISDTKKHLEGEKEILEINKIKFKPLYDEETTEDLSGLFEDFLNNEGKEESYENN
tara:strand:+ start:3859 stop:4191 length:333 start_codon:yes stop_codon:yes gene_type:complete